MVIQLDRLIQVYDMVLYVLEQEKEMQMAGGLPSYNSEFTKFLTF